MNLFNILTVSAPEFTLDLLLAFLLFGEKQKLLGNITAIIKYIAAVILMCISSLLVRGFIPFGVQTILIQVPVFILIIKLMFYTKYDSFSEIVKCGWSKPIYGTIFFMAVIMFAEIIYAAPLIGYFNKSLNDVFSDDIFRLVGSLPERAFQIYTAVSLWSFKAARLDIKKYAPIQKLCYTILVLLGIFEGIFSFTFANLFAIMEIYLRIVFFVACLLLAVINILIFKFISRYTETVVIYEQAKLASKIFDINQTIRNLTGRGKNET